jgi:RNA polymerase sigma factor (sigma-70 family)
LAIALSFWAILECLPQEGEVGALARQEVARLGIDVRAKYNDIRKIVGSHLYSSKLDAEDLMQDVVLAILKKNGTPSAFDPKKSSFSHYVFLIASNVLRTALLKQRRWNRNQRVGARSTIVDDHDPIAAWIHVETSFRIDKTRPLDRANIRDGEGVLN